jgi:hypothetical protein
MDSDSKNQSIRLFIWLIIAFCLAQYFYGFIKMPLKRSLFIDFGTNYNYALKLNEFETNKTGDHDEVFSLLVSGWVESDKGIDFAKQKIPHAGGPALYPPALYLILLPFTWIDYRIAALLWLFIKQLALAAVVLYCLRLQKRKVSVAEVALVVFSVTNFLPVNMDNEVGQINIFTLFFITASFYYYKNKKDLLSGAMLALAVITKWTPFILLVFFVIKGRYKVIVSSLAVLAVAFTLSIIKFGLPLHLIQLKEVMPLYSRNALGNICNQSLGAFFTRLFCKEIYINLPYFQGVNYCNTKGIMNNIGLANMFTVLSVILLTGLSFWACLRERKEESLSFFLLLVLVLLVSTWTSPIHMVLLLLPFLTFFLSADAVPIRSMFLLILSYILIALPYWLDGLVLFRSGIWVVFLSGRLYGMMLLWCFIFLEMRRRWKT